MSLDDLAPSIALLGNSERGPEGFPNPPAFRLTVLLGAGSSLYAKAPSTEDLTRMVERRQVGGAILRALRSRFESQSANFEDVLHVLEELDSLATSSDRAPTMLRGFVRPILSEVGASHGEIRNERFELMEAIAEEFDMINYDSSWRPLYNLLKPRLDIFDLDIFTLNYDLVSDVATYALSMLSGKKWFDGFGQMVYMRDASGFRADQYANWRPGWGHVYLTHAHLHGALSYAYYGSDMRMAHSAPLELVYTANLAAARETWAWARRVALADPKADFRGVIPIVSGLRKMEKLSAQPFANYYAGLAQALSKSPYLMIVGYGAGDEHINYWLREFTHIHNENARVVEIRKSADSEQFTMQRAAAAYDLKWHKYKRLNDAYISDAGIRCLTITGGLTADREFNQRLINAQFTGALRY